MKSKRARSMAVVVLGMALVVGTSAPPVLGGTDTATFNVQTTVPTVCTIDAASGVNFSPYTGTQVDGTGTIAVTCGNGQTASLGLNQGTHASAGSTAENPLRRMEKLASPGNFLSYQLYRDLPRTQVWGDVGTVNVQPITGTGASVVFGVFGRIPTGQNPVAGTYLDVVQVTVQF